MWDVDNLRFKAWHLMVLLGGLLLGACDAEEFVTLGTLEVRAVTDNAIHCSIEVEGEMPVDCGFCYATTKIGAESWTASKVKGSCEQYTISGVIEGLAPLTTYFVRGYAMTVRGRVYTPTISVRTTFRTPQADDNEHPDIDY